MTNSGNTIATACRASSLDHAVIRLYDTRTWRQIEPALVAHALTITALRFSPDDKFLLSVGRDRQCAIFARDDTQETSYTLVAKDLKAHSRMLLDAAWAPTEAGHVFATAGRDKNVHIWQPQESEAGSWQLERKATISATFSVTAVAFLPTLIHDAIVLAYGLEDGSIYLARFGKEVDEAAIVKEEFPSTLLPSMSVTEMAWRPLAVVDSAASQSEGHRLGYYEIAVASEDGSVRIYETSLS